MTRGRKGKILPAMAGRPKRRARLAALAAQAQANGEAVCPEGGAAESSSSEAASAAAGSAGAPAESSSPAGTPAGAPTHPTTPQPLADARMDARARAKVRSLAKAGDARGLKRFLTEDTLEDAVTAFRKALRGEPPWHVPQQWAVENAFEIAGVLGRHNQFAILLLNQLGFKDEEHARRLADEKRILESMTEDERVLEVERYLEGAYLRRPELRERSRLRGLLCACAVVQESEAPKDAGSA